MMKRKYTPRNHYYNQLVQDKEKIITDYNLGNSCATIAKQYGCHSHTIRKFLMSNQVKLRPGGGACHAVASSFKNGYKMIPAPKDYPKKYSNGGLLYYEHILALESKLGRYLTDKEVGHHIDLDKQNNSIDNLVECSTVEHQQIHNQLNELVSKLIKNGVINFDKQKRKYDSTWL